MRAYTLALMVWSIAEIIRHGVTLWTSAVLVYLMLLGVTLWFHRRETAANADRAPSAPQVEGEGETGNSEMTTREIILETIRTKGKVQRRDLLPLVAVSKSTLVRLLDKNDDHW